MVPRSMREDSEPLLEVSSFGVVDDGGHYLQHAALAPNKARTATEGELSVVIHEEQDLAGGTNAEPPSSLGASLGANHNHIYQDAIEESGLLEPATEEVTAVTNATRGKSGHAALRFVNFVEIHRSTILLMSLGIVLLFTASCLLLRR